MANRVALGSTRTAHTVTSVHPTFAGVFNISNPEAVHQYATFSKDGTSNPGSNLYTYVAFRNANYGGTIWDIALNWGISVSVNDTVYFSWRENGLKVSKKNVNVDTAGTKDLLFDSRIRRHGAIYAFGTQSSVSSTGLTISTNKETLGYIPLTIFSEDAKGKENTYINSPNDFDSTANVSMFEFTKTTIKPVEYLQNVSTYSDTASPPTQAIKGGRTYTGQSVTNFKFKTLRIPCAYGYMTSAYFDNPLTQNTSGSSQTISGIGLVNNTGYYKTFGKNRVVAGKLTNSTIGYSNSRGFFVSREGTNITDCAIDDVILGSDTGVVAHSYRGDVQNLSVNYSGVINNSEVPTAGVTSNISSGSSATISIFNPYSLDPLIESSFDTSADQQSSTDSLYSTSTSTSSGTTTITLSTTSTSSLTIATAVIKEDSSLALL